MHEGLGARAGTRILKSGGTMQAQGGSMLRKARTRSAISLLAVAIAGGGTAVHAQDAVQQQGTRADSRTPPSTGGSTPTAQTSAVAGPGIANSTVPSNETISGPAPQDGNQPVDRAAAEGDEILVTGVRQAEQSAIARKRTARTAQDSIVADDVGQFPDKNAAEAISRIAGVALDVGDSGEQGGFTIRGQSADLIRIEVDGMTTLPSGGGTGGRAATVGELSSDLIKSVDVIKGQTADMTPGGVGGTVKIEQRTGLDFKDPLYRLNVQAAYQTLSEDFNPRINAIATQKFFDDRVGLIINGTYEKQSIGTDYSRVSRAQQGYIPLGDLDNSPEKTFTTPFDPAAAAVTSKAGCAALTTTGINSRLNCYAQWEDLVPSYVRPGRQIRGEERFSLQARVDWEINDDLVAFVSYNPNIRKVNSQDYNYSVAIPVGTTGTNGLLATSNIRNVVVNENHYVTSFDMVNRPANVAATVPGYINNNRLTTENRDIRRDAEQYYTQGGLDFISGPWVIKGRVQYSLSKFQRQDIAVRAFAPLDTASFALQPDSGLWTIEAPGVDQTNPASYYPVIGTTGFSGNAQIDVIPEANRNSEWNYQLDAEHFFEDFGPLTRIKAGVQHRTRKNDTYNETGYIITPGTVLSRARSIDQVRACDPTRTTAAAPCVFGSAPASITPANVNTTTDRLNKLHTLTVEQYQNILNASLLTLPGAGRDDGTINWGALDAQVFARELGKYADLSSWNLDCLYECIASDGQTYERPPYHTDEITSSAYIMADFAVRPFGVLLEGNAGVRYQRIKVDAAPVIDFSNRTATPGVGDNGLPTYNVANVLIRRDVGSIQRTSEDWLPSFNLAAWPVEDVLGLRYSIAKQRARPSLAQLTGAAVSNCGIVAPGLREQLEQFLAQNPGAIQDDDPNTDDDAEAGNILDSFVNRCNGRIGNPELAGYGATTQNLSLEWYPNADTQLTGAIYQIAVKTGRPENVSTDGYVLAGNNYAVDTYRDGPGGLKQRGFEIAGRTAFTFLPGPLQYLGGGFNYSYTESNEETSEVDLFTGIALPPRSQSKYYYNVNLWYDDGKLNARVAYQRRAMFYDRTDPDAENRIPASAGLDGSTATSYFKTVPPVYKTGSENLDARASYQLFPKLQLFVEGKNLLNTSIGKYTPNEFRTIGGDTPYMFDEVFVGRTFYFGIIADL
ncbi:TonB-dependent receptor [Croceibacterium mercuriale]|uniref:TonB-dependent receptor n=1 Tax=Croceibacterium mercuriale TaxID=1572751 RepID=UPI00137931E8|nr:TonB-dependent receptor [Croceibacterium mercuriale]